MSGVNGETILVFFERTSADTLFGRNRRVPFAEIESIARCEFSTRRVAIVAAGVAVGVALLVGLAAWGMASADWSGLWAAP